MEQIPSPLNQSLAAALSNRMAAEMSAVSGRAGFWKAVGIGLLGFGLGSAIGIGLYGYSFITRTSTQMEAFTSAFKKAMASIELRGTAAGKVEITPAELTLAKGGTVYLDSSTRLLLDPTSKVAADGELRVQLPSISMPRAPSPKNLAQTRTISNFTVFKSVPFEQGSVLTGWIFLTSAQESPTTQYCYYTERSENPDLAIRVDLATDGVLETTRTAVKALDFSAASSKCVWFRKDYP